MYQIGIAITAEVTQAIAGVTKLSTTLNSLGNMAIRTAANLVAVPFKFAASMAQSIVRVGTIIETVNFVKQAAESFDVLAESLKKAIEEYAKFNHQAMITAAIMEAGGDNTVSTARNVEDAIMDIATRIPVKIKEVSESFSDLARAGYTAKDAGGITELAAKISLIEGMSFKSTTDGLIALQNSFGIASEDLNSYVNMMQMGSNVANMSIQQFFNAAAYSAANFTAAFGNSKDAFAQYVAEIATLHDVGIRGSKAGVYVRGNVSTLQAPSLKQIGQLSKLGVGLTDAQATEAKKIETALLGLNKSALFKSGEKKSVIDRKDIITVQDMIDEIDRLSDAKAKLETEGQYGSSKYKEMVASAESFEEALKAVEDRKGEMLAEFQDAGGKMRDSFSIIKDLATKTDANGISAIFGIKGGQAAITFTQNLDKMMAKYEKIRAASETPLIDEITGKVLEDFQSQLDIIKNTIMSLELLFGRAFNIASLPALKEFAVGIKEAFDVLKTDNGLQNFMDSIVKNAMPGLQTLASNIKNIASLFTDNQKNAKEFISFDYSKEDGSLSTSRQEVKTQKPFAAAIESLSSFLEASGKILADSLSPAVDSVAKVFAEIVKIEFIKLTKFTVPLISDAIAQLYEELKLEKGIGPIIQNIENVVLSFANAFKGVEDLFGPFISATKNFWGSLIGVFKAIEPIFSTLGGHLVGLFRALTQVMSFIGNILKILSPIIGAVARLISNIFKPLSIIFNMIASGIEKVNSVLGPVGDKVVGKNLYDIGNVIVDKVSGSLEDSMVKAASFVGDSLNISGPYTDALSNVYDQQKESAAQFYETTVSSSKISVETQEKIIDVLEKMYNKTKETSDRVSSVESKVDSINKRS